MAPATTSSSADQSSASASSVPLQNPTIFSDRRWVWTWKPARPPHNRWLSCPCQPNLPFESSGLSSRIWTSFFLRICVNSPKSKYACRLVSTPTHPRSAAEPCPCGEKFGPRPIFKIFSLDQIRVDQEKKEVRKRRASSHRSSLSDAVDYFLVSHVTGWAILGYLALELDTGIFPFVFFLDTVLPRSSNLNLKKKCLTGKASLV